MNKSVSHDSGPAQSIDTLDSTASGKYQHNYPFPGHRVLYGFLANGR
jgi:hypothetical protein